MKFKIYLHSILSAIILLSNLTLPIKAAQDLNVQNKDRSIAQGTDSESQIKEQLSKIENAIEEKRKDLNVPGAAIVIVKDDKVIYIKGFGHRDIETKKPVTENTLFAIGSTTKAFTAMSVMMSADEGKLSLEDSPKKYLPYFKLKDEEADSKINIRDLLCHRSGLGRAELAWYTGVLNREEAIRAMAFVKPTAKFREKFLYQNVMFSVAGEIVAKVQNKSYEEFISERIFKPLGMKSANLSVTEMQKTDDYSSGYTFIDGEKEVRKIPIRDIRSVAPAGAINSNVKDLAEWIRLMLGGGSYEGKRFISEKSFNEIVSNQTKIDNDTYYGLGWFLTKRNNQNIVMHDGGIDGFNARITLLPDAKIGFAILTNVSSSPLIDFSSKTIVSNLLGKDKTTKDTANNLSSEIEKEVGTYYLKDIGINIEVSLKDGKLIAIAPNEPVYTLKNIGGRRYEAVGPTPDPTNIFVTFRPVKNSESETEAYLEMPMGNFVLTKVKVANVSTSPAELTVDPNKYKELFGEYEMGSDKPKVEIKLKDGKAFLIVPGQPAYEIVEKEKDSFTYKELPPSFSFMVKRDKDGKVAGLLTKQPQGDFEFKRVPEFVSPISVEELMSKMINAAGGEENLRKHKTLKRVYAVNYEHQGVAGEGTIFTKAPNLVVKTEELFALDKKIASLSEHFDGTNGASIMSFAPYQPLSGKQLEEIKIRNDFYPLLNWKSLYKTVVIKGKSKIEDEEVYIVVKTPEKGNTVTEYVSTKSWLVLRKDALLPIRGLRIPLEVKESYSDYKMVDGEMVPFKTVFTHPVLGDMVVTFKDANFNVEIPDDEFSIPDKVQK
jgi:CubicO group peptidase (beta-lactamase class C family)